MKQRTVALVLGVLAALTVAACGGSSTPPATLNPAFAKTWSGTATILLPAVGNTADAPVWTGQVVVTVSGASASVLGLCGDGTGAITLTGSENSGTWTGSLSCPGFLSFCSATSSGQLVTTLTSATGTLGSTPLNLVILGSGTATCGGVSTTFTISWNGT
jgi:hypothetical protein